MTESIKEVNASFEDMNLKVDDRLQLVAYRSAKIEYYCSLIGYEPGKYLFVTMPQENGSQTIWFSAPLRMGERVDVRFFSGVSIFDFSSSVEFIHTRHNFLELAFPAEVRTFLLRKNLRIKVKMPVRISQINEQELPDPIIATALDMSISGVMLRSDKPLGAADDIINMAFVVKNKFTNENTLVEVLATIRNCREDEGPQGNMMYKHGILFKELKPYYYSMLQHHINDQILQGRQAF